MNNECVEHFCQEIPKVLEHQGALIIYGPFKFKGQFTSHSNERFDALLKGRNLGQAIRDFENIKAALELHGLTFIERLDLPANNHILIFNK